MRTSAVSNRVRSRPDEFVRLVHKRHEALEQRRGFTLSREVVRDAIQECFHFNHFEDYGRQFYRAGSSQCYWVEDEPKRYGATCCTSSFSSCAANATASSSCTRTKRARRRPCRSEPRIYATAAWANDGIFNFHDAKRQINEAVDLLKK